MSTNLIQAFTESAAKFPDRTALHVNGTAYSYRELSAVSNQIATALRSHQASSPTVAILTNRSLSTYASIIGTLRAGRTYVPLNAAWPAARNRRILELTEPDAILVDEECSAAIVDLLPYRERPTQIVYPTRAALDSVRGKVPGQNHCCWEDFSSCKDLLEFDSVDPDSLCYIVCTSGTTGAPKGVMVRHRNAMSFVEIIREIYPATHDDRFAQVADISFDPSVHDMFSAWRAGAAVYCVPKQAFRTVAEYITTCEITTWTSVPSITAYMIQTDTIRPGAFPSMLWTTFGGEAVSYRFAKLWQEAACNAEIGILYGPTEATISVSYYPMPKNAGPEIAVNGIMPIGWPVARTSLEIVNEKLEPVAQGETGELVVGGELVTAGYLKAPEKTDDKFLSIGDPSSGPWYRTGDRAFRSDDGCINFLGRFDDQVKIHGYRVELSEIEVALRDLASCNEAAVVAWPIEDGVSISLHGFVVRKAEDGASLREIIKGCRKLLPPYMVPKRVHFLDAMPMTTTGKTDRKKLTAMLEQGE